MDFVFSAADILLPQTDMKKWATVACDQYTSEPEYWQAVEKEVGDNPSSLRIVLPENYINKFDSGYAEKTVLKMREYEENGIFKEYKDSMIYVERTDSTGKIRKGIIGKIDLNEYDYHDKTDAAVRATEKTVISRIPPRVKIRENASLELPHVMLLIDDADQTVIEPLSEKCKESETLYDFDLMMNSGHIKAKLIGKQTQSEIISALKALSDKNGGFLFSVGDGNHSLATAKECYNKLKTEKMRYALVEIVNLHDSSLHFEPIYRMAFGVTPDKLIDEFLSYCGGEYKGDDAQSFECLYKGGSKTVSVKPDFKLPVGTLQAFLDDYVAKNGGVTVDYVHGVNSVKKLSEKENSVGFIFKGMEKDELFSSVAADGSLPRKTFSMGGADDKRFYIEARKIK